MAATWQAYQQQRADEVQWYKDHDQEDDGPEPTPEQEAADLAWCLANPQTIRQGSVQESRAAITDTEKFKAVMATIMTESDFAALCSSMNL